MDGGSYQEGPTGREKGWNNIHRQTDNEKQQVKVIA